MQVFLVHIGHPGHIDVNYTIKRRRQVSELLHHLPPDAAERNFFEHDTSFNAVFPTGQFHCWGLPPGAQSNFRRTRIGDLVLIVPWIGTHNGGIHYVGVVKAKCPVSAPLASQILWPKTPNQRTYPWLIFFDAEEGYRAWCDFLDDLQCNAKWNPNGRYIRLTERHLATRGGADGYLRFLREQSFRPS